MSISSPFIERPIATTLLTIAVTVAGGLAYFQLPVSPLPQIDYPTIAVNATLPGASPELRRPLGIATVGGLIMSQMLTLFTTPVIYFYLDGLRKRSIQPQTAFKRRPGVLVPGGIAESAD